MFELLKIYGLKLNHSKRVFGVTSSKFLGFIVSQQGIEIDPSKKKGYHRVASKDRKRSNGFLVSYQLYWPFYYQLTITYKPLFKLFRENMHVVQNEDYVRAF